MGRNDEDLALVGRCIAVEEGAWRVFVDRFAPTVRGLARRYLRLHGKFPDEAEIDDVVQDVMLAVTRRDYHLLRNYDPTYTFKTYLGVITRTEVHRVLRKKRPVLGSPDEIENAAPAQHDASGGVVQAEEREILTRALDQLPERDAEILRIRFLQEKDYKHIAATLRIPEASVGQTLFRAKQRLLEILKGVLNILV